MDWFWGTFLSDSPRIESATLHELKILAYTEEHLLASAIHGLGSSISGSTAELGPKLDRLNKELGEREAIIETAGKKVSEVVDSRAQEASR